MCTVNFTLLTFFQVVNRKILTLRPSIRAAALIKGRTWFRVKAKYHLFSVAGYLFVLFPKMKMESHNVSQIDSLLCINVEVTQSFFNGMPRCSETCSPLNILLHCEENTERGGCFLKLPQHLDRNNQRDD